MYNDGDEVESLLNMTLYLMNFNDNFQQRHVAVSINKIDMYAIKIYYAVAILCNVVFMHFSKSIWTF